MLDSILLGFSLILIFLLIIFFKFAENKLAALANPEEIVAIYIHDRLLSKKAAYSKPIYISDYLNAINLIEDEDLRNNFLLEVAEKSASLDENTTFFKTELGYNITLIKPVEEN